MIQLCRKNYQRSFSYVRVDDIIDDLYSDRRLKCVYELFDQEKIVSQYLKNTHTKIIFLLLMKCLSLNIKKYITWSQK